MHFKTNRVHAASLMYFDAVWRAASIREAARRLNVASSAVNRQILHLEAEIGAKLFDRFPTGLRLTATGEVLARHVANVIQDAERVNSDLDSLRGLRSGHVELATLDGLCHETVPAAVERMHVQHRRITISVRLLEAAAISEAIAAGDVHLGLVFEARKRPDLRQIASVRLKLGLAVRSDALLARRGTLDVRDCQEIPIVMPRVNLGHRDQILTFLRQASFERERIFESGSIEMMKQLVLRGLGGACTTRLGLEREIKDGRIVHVPLSLNGTVIHSELGLYSRTDSTLSMAASALANELRTSMERIAAEEESMNACDGEVDVEPERACEKKKTSRSSERSTVALKLP